MIRKATFSDVPRVLEMGQRFVAETAYAELVKIDPSRLESSIVSLIDQPDGVVWVSESQGRVRGMLAAMVYAHPFSGERTAFELVWWVDPGYRGQGLRLLRVAEQWAKERGATHMQMVAPNDRVGAVYERCGYAPVETSYQRAL